MPGAPKNVRSAFAELVEKALRDARERGMNDPKIYEATTVSPATFHRWQDPTQMDRLPQLDRMLAFVDGLGVPRFALMAALDAVERTATPEPTIPPEVRDILRILNDPRVEKREKYHITETLRSLANRHRVSGPRPIKRAG